MKVHLLAAAVVAAMNSQPAPLPADDIWDDVVSIPRVEEGIVYDIRNPIVTARTALISPDGRFGGNCLRFTGSQRVSFGGTPYSFYGDFTVEGFYNFESLTNGNQYMFDFGSNGLTMRYYRSGGDGLFVNLNGSNTLIQTSFKPTVGIWHHVALVREASILKLFVDGVLIGQTSFSTNQTYTTYTIGNYGSGGGYSMYGKVDQFRVTMAALYKENFTPPSSPFTFGGPEANYDPHYSNVNLLIKDPIGGVFPDTTGISGNLVANGGAVADLAVKRFSGGSMSFPTEGSYYTIPHHASDRFGFGTSEWTIDCFVRPGRANTGVQDIIARRINGTAGGFSMTLDNMQPTFRVSTATTWALTLGSLASTSLQVGQWYHLAACRMGNTIMFFINGRLIDSGTLTGSLTNSTIPLSIGASADGSEPFVGHVDRVRITRGVGRYCSNFTPKLTTDFATNGNETPSANDPHFGKVVSLHRFTKNIDAGPDQFSVVTRRVTSVLDSTRKLFGEDTLTLTTGATGGINYNNATKPLLYANDWTVEAWINTDFTDLYTLPVIGQWHGTTSGSWALAVRGGKIGMLINGTGTLLSSQDVADGQWHHVAAVARGGIIYLYVDGQLSSGGTMTIAAKPSYNGNIQVGYNVSNDVPIAKRLNVSRIRVTNGKGRYSANFTPDINTVQLKSLAA